MAQDQTSSLSCTLQIHCLGYVDLDPFPFWILVKLGPYSSDALRYYEQKLNNNNNNIKSSLFHSMLTSLGYSTKFWIKVALSNQSTWVGGWLYNIRVLKWYFYNIFSNTFITKFMWKVVTSSNLNSPFKLFFYSLILTNKNLFDHKLIRKYQITYTWE